MIRRHGDQQRRPAPPAVRSGGRQPFTVGIEEELQLLDPLTGALASGIERLIADAPASLRLQRELLQCMVELSTEPAATAEAAAEELAHLRARLARHARRVGLDVAAAGTHPFSHHAVQEVTDQPRYQGLLGEMRWLARRNCVFGLHVHVGCDDLESLIAAANRARSSIPELLALSGNSPFSAGIDTGFASARAQIVAGFPRSGLPPAFAGWRAFERYVDAGRRAGILADATRLWWDVRPSPRYGTVEIRVFDAQTRVDRVGPLAALVQALVATASADHERGHRRPDVPELVLAENRLRAARDGLDAVLVDVERDTERSARIAVLELLDDCEPAARRLGSLAELRACERLLLAPTGAQEQRTLHDRTGSLPAVTRWLADRTAPLSVQEDDAALVGADA
ncbi:MAG: YbdK family carboxylate-amine ligase [Thermoleophilia bacterium]